MELAIIGLIISLISPIVAIYPDLLKVIAPTHDALVKSICAPHQKGNASNITLLVAARLMRNNIHTKLIIISCYINNKWIGDRKRQVIKKYIDNSMQISYISIFNSDDQSCKPLLYYSLIKNLSVTPHH